jgi:hypothetical protein
MVLLNPDDAIQSPPIQLQAIRWHSLVARTPPRRCRPLQRVVITFAPHASEILDFLKSQSIPHTRLGEVTKDPTLTIEAAGKTFAWPVAKLRAPIRKNHPLAR